MLDWAVWHFSLLEKVKLRRLGVRRLWSLGVPLVDLVVERDDTMERAGPGGLSVGGESDEREHAGLLKQD